MKLAKIKFYLKRLYRISLSHKKYETLVWEDLKKLHVLEGWSSGVFEKERYIETTFEIEKEKLATFFYMIYDDFFHCRTRVVENYPEDLTTDIFILASHFNNVLNKGIVVVNVHKQHVEYNLQKELLVPLLYSGEIRETLIRHYNISKDIHSGFQRLIEENEAPAIIIADLLKKNDEKEQ